MSMYHHCTVSAGRLAVELGMDGRHRLAPEVDIEGSFNYCPYCGLKLEPPEPLHLSAGRAMLKRTITQVEQELGKLTLWFDNGLRVTITARLDKTGAFGDYPYLNTETFWRIND